LRRVSSQSGEAGGSAERSFLERSDTFLHFPQRRKTRTGEEAPGSSAGNMAGRAAGAGSAGGGIAERCERFYINYRFPEALIRLILSDSLALRSACYLLLRAFSSKSGNFMTLWRHFCHHVSDISMLCIECQQ